MSCDSEYSTVLTFNAALGYRFDDGRITATLKGQNLFNETVQQHIFGDIIKRSVFAELRFAF